ncbi:uncharacterized protein [Arachis hypogaea]|uniref:uncharacterized protein n=1 Tax=Arachis hypogaea TaxID=3818 RepID=UPI003B21B23F
MASLQAQNEEIARKRKVAKQKIVTKFDVATLWGQDGSGWEYVGSDGDFNEIVHVEERKDAASLPRSAEDFKSWIQDMQLVDLLLTNQKFTWFRGRSCSRIDRALVNVEWLDEFPATRVRGGPRDLSDHCPIIVEDNKQRGSPRPFRSLHSWFTHEGFLCMVKEEWRALGEI